MTTLHTPIQEIKTREAPEAIGPYSQGIRVGPMVFVSGQIPFDPATGKLLTGSVEEQAERCLINLAAILKAAGSDLSLVVKTTVFLKDMSDFSKVNEVYSRFFKKPYPARACVEVARLPRDVSVEIDCIAYWEKST